MMVMHHLDTWNRLHRNNKNPEEQNASNANPQGNQHQQRHEIQDKTKEMRKLYLEMPQRSI